MFGLDISEGALANLFQRVKTRLDDRVAEILRAHAAMDVKMILGAMVLEAEQFGGAARGAEDVTAICVKAR